MLTTPTTPLTAECEPCNGEGYREWSRDCFSHRSGHYTEDGTETCEKCDGDGWYVVGCEHDSSVPAVVEIGGLPLCAECAAEACAPAAIAEAA